MVGYLRRFNLSLSGSSRLAQGWLLQRLESKTQLQGGYKMSHIKRESVNKCFSLLREYINETSSQENSNRKKTAILALNQLRKVTAGTMSQENSIDDVVAPDAGCNVQPRAYGSPYS
jgi:predicted YcjX-like family ATPase